MLVARGERVVFEEDFAQIFEIVLDVLQFVHHVLRCAAAELVAVERLRNHAVAAAVRAPAPAQNHNQRVQVRTVEILLVAAVQMLAVDFRDPREFVQVLYLRALGLEVCGAVRLAEGEARNLVYGNTVAPQAPREVPACVVRLADNHEVECGFHLQALERLGGGMRTHDGDLHVRERILDGMHHLEVVQDARRARAANDKRRVKLLDALERLGQVQLHRGAVNQLNLVAIRFGSAGGVTQEHGPVKSARFSHAGAARLATEHRMERRIQKSNTHKQLQNT